MIAKLLTIAVAGCVAGWASNSPAADAPGPVVVRPRVVVPVQPRIATPVHPRVVVPVQPRVVPLPVPRPRVIMRPRVMAPAPMDEDYAALVPVAPVVPVRRVAPLLAPFATPAPDPYPNLYPNFSGLFPTVAVCESEGDMKWLDPYCNPYYATSFQGEGPWCEAEGYMKYSDPRCNPWYSQFGG